MPGYIRGCPSAQLATPVTDNDTPSHKPSPLRDEIPRKQRGLSKSFTTPPKVCTWYIRNLCTPQRKEENNGSILLIPPHGSIQKFHTIQDKFVDFPDTAQSYLHVYSIRRGTRMLLEKTRQHFNNLIIVRADGTQRGNTDKSCGIPRAAKNERLRVVHHHHEAFICNKKEDHEKRGNASKSNPKSRRSKIPQEPCQPGSPSARGTAADGSSADPPFWFAQHTRQRRAYGLEKGLSRVGRELDVARNLNGRHLDGDTRKLWQSNDAEGCTKEASSHLIFSLIPTYNLNFSVPFVYKWYV